MTGKGGHSGRASRDVVRTACTAGTASSNGNRDYRTRFVGPQRPRAPCHRFGLAVGTGARPRRRARYRPARASTPWTNPTFCYSTRPAGRCRSIRGRTKGLSPAYAVGLYEWVTTTGYRWVGDTCVVGRSGREITPDDYLPRRVMGEYLEWFYATLVASAPAKVEIVHHRVEAVDIEAQRTDGERVLLADGERSTSTTSS